MPFPGFMVIGAMKAGTTSLWEYLRAHPQVFMAEPKELHFFSRHWDRGLDWYGEQFAAAAASQLSGEASTTYTMYPRYEAVAERIHSTLPEVKLVYLLRHPLARIESHYRDDVTKGLERKSIDKAVLANPNYIDFSRYGVQIDRYLDLFPAEQLLIVDSDRLRADPATTVGRVFRFLGVAAAEGTLSATEVHRTADKVVRRRWAQRLRRLPGYRRVADRAPGTWRRLNYRMTTRAGRRVDEVLSAETRRTVLVELEADWLRLRRYAPELVSAWEEGP